MNIVLPEIPKEFFSAASPIFILAIGSMISILQSVTKRLGSPGAIKVVLYASLIGALAATAANFGIEKADYLQGAYLSESLARFGFLAILSISLVVALFFDATYLNKSFFRGEIASLFQLVVLGALVLVAADEMISLFTGLEIASIGIYALVGYVHPSQRSMEGAIKYFILGAFATGFLLFGFALMYAGSGTMRISEIITALAKESHPWMQLGGLFVLAGLGFKLALAPFHFWGPDAYEGAPTGITAFMATAVKVMILVLMLRFMAVGMQYLGGVWLPGLLFLASLSMILGNIMALVQSSLKRMLAYSSIAHSGYMAVAICAISATSGELPVAAVLYYLLGYTILSLGTFGILMWLENQVADNLQLEDLAGLSKKYPWACAAMAVFMFSFAGFPPTVGFMSKFFVFNAAIKSQLYGLVLIGVLGSSISLFYYLRVLVKMFMTKPSGVVVDIAPQRSWIITSLTVAAIVATILLGTILPESTLQLMRETSGAIVSH